MKIFSEAICLTVALICQVLSGQKCSTTQQKISCYKKENLKMAAYDHHHNKIRLEDPQYLTNWNRQGVLSYVQKQLKSIVADDGVLCISTLQELVLRKKILEEPWIGFVHDVPQNNLLNYPDLEHMVIDECFVKSLPYCQGLFAMSQGVQDYLVKKLEGKIPVAKVLYPITPFPDNKLFNWDSFDLSKGVVNIGNFFQNYQAIYDLRIPNNYQKILLKPPDLDLYELNRQKVTVATNDTVIIKDSLTDEEYDDLLRSSIVFLNLYNSTISTTVIECIGRNTPLVVNRLPGLEEYLGVDYPLFYDTIEEAADIILDKDKLIAATAYLKSLPMKAELTGDQFLNSFINTAIYRYLPLPPSQRSNPQQTRFPRFDLTVSICSYKRVYNLKHQLDCFKNQDFTGTFEVILWNNNHETQQEVASIAAPFMKKLNIRLIQSTENYYCIVRLAVANLMRSDLLLVCDDDVVPQPNFISRFVSKYKEYGPRVVLCCRGHVFQPYKVNEEKPEKFWEHPDDGYYKKLFDQNQPDRQVHFLHACTSLFPRQLLLEASAYDLPSPDFALVDDYWLSFVLSHHFKVPLWKIQGGDTFQLTPCADDPEKALWLQKKVKYQMTNMYIYHMRQGWPASTPLGDSMNNWN